MEIPSVAHFLWKKAMDFDSYVILPELMWIQKIWKVYPPTFPLGIPRARERLR